jgi:SAM-dependent methyltransferase
MLGRRMSGYGFDPSWSDERRRLALIERCYDPMTISRLAELGVAAGWRCVDVGAGGGSIARWLRDRVGPDGSVVAVDLDTRFFENEPGIESRRLDILADELERDAYDLVHCRLLLIHLRGKQLDAARRLVAALRPDGVLLASEIYLGAMLASPTPALASVWRAFHEAMPNADYGWAPGLPATLQAAGLTNVEAFGYADVVRGGTPEAESLRLTVEAVRERIPANVGIDAGLNRLRDPTAFEPGLVWYTAWGRRSAS